jgi:hypothetical protein
MSSNQDNHPHIPRLQIDTETLLARITHARSHACDQCQDHVTSLIAEITGLIAEIIRLHSALITERLVSANLMAAIRAALGAEHDGEPDPLAYLRDEIGDDEPDAARERWWSR